MGIYCYETGKTYSTQVAVARDIGCTRSAVSYAVRHATTIKGLHFISTDVTNPILKPKSKRLVRHIPTGAVYESPVDAAMSLGVSDYVVYYSLSGRAVNPVYEYIDNPNWKKYMESQSKLQG